MQHDNEKQLISEFILLDNKEQQIEVLCQIDEPGLIKNEKLYSILTASSKILLSGESVNTITLLNALRGQWTPVEISELSNYSSSCVYIDSTIKELKKGHYKERLIKTIESKLKLIKENKFYDEYEGVKNKLIADLNAFSLDDSSDFIDMDFYKGKIKEQLSSTRTLEGYSWGITDLDVWTSGIVTPRFYVLGGLKKSGKTRFIIHTLKELHKQQVESVFLSMEMPAYEVTKLLYASMGDINDIRFRSGSTLRMEERETFESTHIDKNYLSVECKVGLKIEGLLTRIRRYAKLGFKVVFIDYLQRVNHNRNNQAQELEDICIKIADSARDNNVSIVLLSQLNALAEREVPTPGHLKGSGGIGESADTIIMFDNLYRRTKSEQEKNKIDLYIESRYGDSGKLSLYSDLGKCKFENFEQHQTKESF